MMLTANGNPAGIPHEASGEGKIKGGPATGKAVEDLEVMTLLDRLAVPDDPDERNARPPDAAKKAGEKLLAMGSRAFPLLRKHLDDARSSDLYFTGLRRGTIGDACGGMIRNLLEDFPEGYDGSGFSRLGRDGVRHVRPCRPDGGFFEEVGGLQTWLEANDKLSFMAMRIKVLEWSLEREKGIGVANAEGYFTHILPLEIQLARRKAEAGEDAGDEMKRLQGLLERQDPGTVPGALLPDRNGESASPRLAAAVASEEEAAAIRKLIDQLWMDVVPRTEKSGDSPPENPYDIPEDDITRENRRRAKRCALAFERLSNLGELAFPFLIEHLEDKRPSVDFHGHLRDRFVGTACHLIIRYQIEGYPEDYGQYGYQRIGKDGGLHVVPRNRSDSPFWDIRNWLESNRDVSLAGKRIRAMEWALDQERKIGAFGAEGYYVNILPLEIGILERKAELGADVGGELKRLKKIRDERKEESEPRELLPVKE